MLVDIGSELVHEAAILGEAEHNACFYEGLAALSDKGRKRMQDRGSSLKTSSKEFAGVNPASSMQMVAQSAV